MKTNTQVPPNKANKWNGKKELRNEEQVVTPESMLEIATSRQAQVVVVLRSAYTTIDQDREAYEKSPAYKLAVQEKFTPSFVADWVVKTYLGLKPPSLWDNTDDNSNQLLKILQFDMAYNRKMMKEHKALQFYNNLFGERNLFKEDDKDSYCALHSKCLGDFGSNTFEYCVVVFGKTKVAAVYFGDED
eukprot:Phypoly_transcript_19565.p1 GENE.Phypoly_transcript_19565~~Phypoly_transcript_19565.p1  ORF type:complete len:188 (+),score=32.18 Phypoly_transcript_19565:85-648(+)